MNRFKVGDKVRVKPNKSGGWDTKYAGKTGMVTNPKPRGYVSGVSLVKLDEADKLPFLEENLELVTPAESELERLVRTANEGAAANYKLRSEYAEEIEYRFTGSEWLPLKGAFQRTQAEYRIKSKPKFEPFTVGQGWKVTLEGDTLHVGCQTFSAKTLKLLLPDLCRRPDVNSCNFGDTYLSASRSGVSARGKGTISWTDADRILEALEKAGI